MSERREKEKRKVRYASAKKRVEAMGEGRGGNFVSTTFKVPEGCEKWVWPTDTEDLKRVKADIIPYIVKNNRLADPGMAYWERTYFVHPKIGAKGGWYCCLWENWKEPCPVCQDRERLQKERRPKDEWKHLYPRMRQAFLMKDPEQSEKLFYHDCFNSQGFGAFRGMGELIDMKLEDMDEEDSAKLFSLDEGMRLKMYVTVGSYNDRPTYSPATIDFIPRKKQYDPNLVDEMPCLDDCLIKTEYDELKKIYEQGGLPDEDDDDDDEDDSELDDEKDDKKPAGKKSKSKDDDEDDDDDDSEIEDKKSEPAKKSTAKKNEDPTAAQFGLKVGHIVTHKKGKWTGEIKHISDDGTSMRIEDEEGEMHKAVGPEEVLKVKTKEDEDEEDDDDSDLEEKKPATKSAAKPSKKPAAKDDDDDDDDDEDDSELDDDDDDDEPPKKPVKKPAADEDDDDDDEDDSDLDDDDDDDPEPAPRRKK